MEGGIWFGVGLMVWVWMMVEGKSESVRRYLVRWVLWYWIVLGLIYMAKKVLNEW